MPNGHLDDIPLDEWEEEDPKNDRGTRPHLDAGSERLRQAWINAVCHFHEMRTGNKCFYKSKIAWDGGVCPITNKHYTPVWPKIVEAARQRGLDPVVLVESLFSSLVADHTPRTPMMLVSSENITRCCNSIANVVKKAESILNTEEAVFRSALWAAGLSVPDKVAATRFVLNDTGRSLSPLFRYCVALMSDLPDIATVWKRAALRQFEKTPAAYQYAWRKILPIEMLISVDDKPKIA